MKSFVCQARPSEYFNMILLLSTLSILCQVDGFWDRGTTTPHPHRTDTYARTSFFRWQRTEFETMHFWMPRYIDWEDVRLRRKLCVVAGISIDFTPLSTATIMNRRILITSANYLDPYMNRPKDLRIWALGRAGHYNTPYRYRVWRIWRVLPKSKNPEHQHGPRGVHVPRHDVAVIISWDQIYVYNFLPYRYMYAYRAPLTLPHQTLTNELYFAGSGYEYLQHVFENYKIFFTLSDKSKIVDCSKYLPKWWGKFICLKNTYGFPGLQNGGPLLSGDYLVGVGCFEIRYNEDRIFVFTDLRYYTYLLYQYADIYPGQYYEYAYPQWGVKLGALYHNQWPINQQLQIRGDLYPLGK